jgi:hypothetical protein
MEPEKPVDASSADSAVAHEHIARVANEYLRLRGKLAHGFGKSDNTEASEKIMDYEQMIQKRGDTAEEIIQLRADALRKRDPSLTPEQAFAAVYTAPENLHLRRAERRPAGSSDTRTARSRRQPFQLRASSL